MKINPQSNINTGFLLFIAGLLLGTLLFGGLVWSDVEAVFYGLPHLTTESFDGFACPPLMTRSETANLRVTVRNETDLPIDPLVRVEISTPGVPFSDRKKTPLEPGQSATFEWPISKNNIDLGQFIFAKAFRYPDYKTSLAEATCGILVVNFPFLNGSTLLILWVGTSIICTLAGLWVLEKQFAVTGQKTSILAALRLLAVAMLLGIILGIQGAWPPGILMLVVIILLVTVLLFFALSR